ncbi:AAA family ATPase [Pseudomonas citronellolis]|uniref:AAA family ATPase n=1 Tax=Pseudomonas citronellolis TaxID=53408 RepID=UPI00248E8137|nr:AAA family ATPase [Pseudomonas citronellolis]
MSETEDTKDTGQAFSSTRRFSIRNLYLDPNNYRIIHEEEQIDVPDEQAKDKIVAQRTLRLLTGDRNQHIQDLIDSFKANGYLPVDQIQVRAIADGGYIVVEGNRRVAALKVLHQERENKGADIGKLDPEIFSQVPVVIYNDADEMHHLTLMALKHISGNKKWGEWNQAKLLEKMNSTYKISEDEICKKIGISKVELRRSLRALSLVAQYRASDYGDQFNETRFPIFRQAVRSQALKEWLGWSEDKASATNSTNRDLFFSLLSREPAEDVDDDGEVGLAERYLEPAINKRDDIDLLAKIISDPKALDQLKITRDLNSAYRASDLVFKERQEAAVKSISIDIDTLSQLAIRPSNLSELEHAQGKLQTIINRTRAVSATSLVGVDQKSVFHDRIDRHFESIFVGSYKKLKNLRIDTLSKINLFAGLNNSGKTTLLEAIYLLARQNDFDGLLEVMRRRGKFSADQVDPEWVLEQINGDEYIISGKFDNSETSTNIKAHSEEDAAIDKSRYLSSIEIDAKYGSHRNLSCTRMYKGRERETHGDSIKHLCPVIFTSPFFLNEPHRYANYYHRSTQAKALPTIFSFLREKILPTLQDIRLTDERQRFVVSDERFEQGVDLSAYGEGLQRMFFLSLLFASAQNGVLLIDEFENAIHTQLIGPFSKFIHSMAENFNVQVFITSHSKECIDAFAEGITTDDDMAYHALVMQDGIIAARQFSGPEFKSLLAAGDVDLREAT